MFSSHFAFLHICSCFKFFPSSSLLLLPSSRIYSFLPSLSRPFIIIIIIISSSSSSGGSGGGSGSSSSSSSSSNSSSNSRSSITI